MSPALLTSRPRLLALLLFASAAPLWAASPRDELLRHVPDDVGFCLIVTDLRGHSAALAESPFAEQFRASPAGQALFNAPELKQLDLVEQQLRQILGIGWVGLRDDILGDAFVFAYRPGPPGQPKQEEGLFLIRAHDEKKLAELVERFNRVQKESGELERLEVREHAGSKYVCRIEKKDKEPSYYYLNGPVLLLTTQEAMLKRSLERARSLPPNEPAPLVARLGKLGGDGALVALWVNPRSFDAEIAAKVQAAADDAALRTFGVCWKALDGMLLTVRLDRELTIGLAVEARPDALPPALRRLLSQAAQPSELWRHFPDDALFAAAGRIDAVALMEALGEFLPVERRTALLDELNRTVGAPLGKKDVLKEVLPFVGPDWGVCVVAPPADGKNWFPQGILAVRVAQGDRTAPVDRALLKAVEAFAFGIVLSHNQAHPKAILSLRSMELDGRQIQYLDGPEALPPGLQPAFALVDGHLLLASSPEVIRRFGTSPGPALDPDAPVPVLRISVKGWRTFLKQRREPIVAFLADRENLPPEEVSSRLDKVLAVLEFVDRVELKQKSTPGQVILSLTVTPSKPLRK
jgi:hypothetical protein